MIESLTIDQKMAAMAARFYNNLEWIPKAGDYYTTSRNDLELYRVVTVENGKIYTEYCTNPGALADWDYDGFTTDGFGPCRVYVPEYVINMASAK